ncbi:hypothetical protein [Granulicella sp. S190]|uniref:hypothetical protein n=1 Tax=Granulicella sp. S190 TaxID=1747226 RepID=UPI00131D1E6C|nr:hypothetical protein [Granulicella sp. S190]
MFSCTIDQLRLTGLQLGIALCIAIAGTPVALNAQQPTLVASAPAPAPESSSIAAPSEPAEPSTLTTADLPDAPSALLYPQSTQSTVPSKPIETTDPNAVSPNGTQQTKRILGIVPNFRSVSADTKLPPMTPKEKFLIAGKDTFDYSSFFIAGIQAGFAMNSASYPEFHQGLKGYGRYYWHTLADTADENFWVGGLGPIIFKQDNRFYTLGHGGFRKRALYAVSRVVISRKDDGDATFNFAEIIGSGAASGISSLYYPTKYRTWTKVGQKWLTSDIIDGFNFFYKEFWPDVNKRIFHTH